MSRIAQTTSSVFLLAAVTAGCGDGASSAEGLAVEVSFAAGVPRSTRDDAVRVEVYLVDSCDSVEAGDRPDDATESTFVLRDGTEGPLLAIPAPGEYGLHAVAQDSDCAVVGAACQAVTIEPAQQEAFLIELGVFSGEGCADTHQCSLDTGDCILRVQDCVDMDGDGLGDGTLGNSGCVDATTDSDDGDGTVCADTDGDTCDDCASGFFDPLDDGVDTDGDGICDSGDDCVDVDADGLGDGTLGNAGCVDTITDSDDADGVVCADTDGDGCDDCTSATFDPSNDGSDADGDGVCSLGDCDDGKPFCAAVCTDLDGDGYCIDTDCDDAVSACTSDCATNTDGGEHVDCFEVFCGSNPESSGSECVLATTELEYENAIDAANANLGPDYIVLGDFTMTAGAPAINDDAGLTIRQLAGATLVVNSGGNRLVFDLRSANNLIDGVRVVNVLNAEDIVKITANDNTVQNCVFEGFERRGIYVDGGDNAKLLHNVITGGTRSQGNEIGAIIIRDTIGSVVAGNTVALNAMDGLQIRKATAPVIDHNTIADNGGSGLELYGDPSSDVCIRNNNVTGNADFGLNASKVTTFDISAACTAPLSPGPAYGNNDFANAGGSCGGSECAACACLPTGLFWTYSADPLFRSSTPGDLDFYCLDPSATLVDGGDDLLLYDLNGAAAGNFNGSGPDIGGREDGPGDCD